MRWPNYLRYFFYIGKNWNYRLARLILREEIRGEYRFGIQTTGADNLHSLAKQGVNTEHASIYMPVSYVLLEKLLAQLPPNCKEHFFDFGCGKGRALCVAAQWGFKKVSGVDFSEKFCRQAQKNLKRIKPKIKGTTCTVLHGQAEDTPLPDDVDCVFLFNPFDESILARVMERIAASRIVNPRMLHLIYVNPQHRDLVGEHGFREIFHISEMTYLEASVWVAGEHD
jgi:SAM-dependent methyltransferase